MIALLIIGLAAILIYSSLYKEKADARARKIRQSKYGYLYLILAIATILVVILTGS